MEAALSYCQAVGTPVLCLPLIYLLIRIKMSRLMEHSNTFYHLFIWMEILTIAFIVANAISVALEPSNLGDLQYVHILLDYFVHLLLLSSSLITPLLAAAAVPKSTRVWDELLFRLLLVASLLLPAIVYFLILVQTKDESLPRIDIRNIEFTRRLISLLCSTLITLTAVPIAIYGVAHVEWAGESKSQLRERNCVVVGAAGAVAHVMHNAMQAINAFSYIANNAELSKTVQLSTPVITSLVLFLPPIVLVLVVPSIRDALRGRTKTARRLSLSP